MKKAMVVWVIEWNIHYPVYLGDLQPNMGILMNKPVQWKVTSFLVGSSDENSAVFCQAKPFIGQEIFPVIQHMDTSVKATQAELFEKASDM